DDTEHELTYPAPTPAEWISYDIPLSDFAGLASTEHLAQLIMVKAPLGTMFVDNVFYYKEPVKLDLTVVLEGPFNGFNMNKNLNPTYLPLDQPYDVSPWNYNGDENVGSIPNTNVVDWVLIELRDASSAAQANSATMIGQQAAFLLRNGSVVGLDGMSDLIFDVTILEDLFVVIWHRNHLSVLSASALERTNGLYSYSFATGADAAYGGNLKSLGGGVWGMYGGNGLADQQIDDLDKTTVWDLETGESGYLQSDFNMDGQADNADKNEVWLLNNGTNISEYQLIWEDNFDMDGVPDADK
ncbi:MAG: hypothetical protein JW731_16745, partial [Bacteroidales bacterium]|nr:hypothetical protein [Bacteroidales bacterium]